MKGKSSSNKIRILRGRCASTEVREIIIDDGRINTGYRVRKFNIMPVDLSVSNSDVIGTLALAKRDCTLVWDFSKQTQIGWASAYMVGTYHLGDISSLIAPDHKVVRSLFVTGRAAAALSADVDFNYLIELEEISLTDDEAVLAILKEVQQDVADN